MRLEHYKNFIISEERTIKRSGIHPPRKYWIMQKHTLETIDTTIRDLNQRVKYVADCKEKLRNEMRNRHGIISKRTLTVLWEELKGVLPLIKPSS